MQILLREMRNALRPEPSVLEPAKQVVADLNTALRKAGLKAKAVQGGSTAKGTFLKQDHDVDLFVRFDFSYKNQDISDLLEKALPFPAQRVHGSRDYFQFQDHLKYEIVPVLAVRTSRQAQNVTDMSPLHVDWVLKQLQKKPGLRDEIRLAKQFCKAAGVYGAESYIKGFSGHILDILIIHYGSFLALLRKAITWRPPIIIDPEHKLKDPLNELNPAKVQSPLIIVDPVQDDRNAAAALSTQCFLTFQKQAQKFLKQPSKSFFTIRHLIKKDCKFRKGEWTYLVVIKPLQGKDDVVGSKLLKAFQYLKGQLVLHGFTIRRSQWVYDTESFFCFSFPAKLLPAQIEQEGPPMSRTRHAAAFRKKHPRAIVRKGRLYAKVKPRYRKPETLLRKLLADSQVKKRIRSATLEAVHAA